MDMLRIMPAELGKFLILVGVILVVAGVLFLFGDRIPFVGKLPGD